MCAALTYVFAGQSNARRHFTDSNPTGASVFAANLESLTDATDVSVHNLASGGSAADRLAQNTTNNTNYWYDTNAGLPGPLLVNAVTAIQNLGSPIDGIIWAQGEQEAKSIGGETQVQTDVSRYITATEAIFDYFRSELGDADLDIYIQELGTTTRPYESSFDVVREAQAQIANADSNVHIAAVTTDIALADSVHFTASGYQTVAGRLADYVANDISADRLVGTSGNDLIYSYLGDDQVFGGAGNDVLVAGAGNDTAYGEEGNDYLYGGDGVDVLVGGPGADVLLGQGGFDYLYGGPGFDYLYGGDETDVLVGNEDTDVIYGENGVDWMYGGPGVDWLLGGNDADMMFGEADSDLMFGGEGNDYIDAGPGNDWSWGGGGADRFVFGTGWGNDVVFDFQDGIDRIDMTTAANVAGIGNLTISTGGGYAVISDGTNTVSIAGLTDAQITSADFLF